MSSEFKAGELVQCIDSSDGAECYLERGKVYVVEGLEDVLPHMRPNLKLIGVDKRWCWDRFVKVDDAADPVDVRPRFEFAHLGSKWCVLDNTLQRVAVAAIRETADRIMESCQNGDIESWIWIDLCKHAGPPITRLDFTPVTYEPPPAESVPSEPVAATAPPNIYARSINGTTIDIYDIVTAYQVTNAAAVHAIKKLLMAGRRGSKSEKQDYEEACAAVRRAVELCEKGGVK